MTQGESWRFTAVLWQYPGEGGWHFVTMPPADAEHLREVAANRIGGFGSVRVDALIGDTAWATSVFPDAARDSFVLPVKASVRRAEKLDAGDEITVSLSLAQ